MTKHHENKRRPRRGSASQRAKIRSRAKRLLVEGLEQRTLLDGALRSTAEVASALSGKTITGVTIVSHGLTLANDGGDQLLPLAAAIRNRIGPDKAWLLDYDVSVEGGAAGFDVSAIEDSGGGPLPGGTRHFGRSGLAVRLGARITRGRAALARSSRRRSFQSADRARPGPAPAGFRASDFRQQQLN